MNIFKKIYNFIFKSELNIGKTFNEYNNDIEQTKGVYEDPIIFFRDYIDHYQLKYYSLKFDQKQIIDSFINKRKLVIKNKPENFSNVLMSLSFLTAWLMCTRHNYTVGVVTSNSARSKIFKELVEKIIKSIRTDKMNIEIIDDTPQTMTLKGLDSSLIVKSITPTDLEGTFRGIDVDLMIYMDISHLKHIDEFFPHMEERRSALTYADTYINGTIVTTQSPFKEMPEAPQWVEQFFTNIANKKSDFSIIDI